MLLQLVHEPLVALGHGRVPAFGQMRPQGVQAALGDQPQGLIREETRRPRGVEGQPLAQQLAQPLQQTLGQRHGAARGRPGPGRAARQVPGHRAAVRLGHQLAEGPGLGGVALDRPQPGRQRLVVFGQPGQALPGKDVMGQEGAQTLVGPVHPAPAEAGPVGHRLGHAGHGAEEGAPGAELPAPPAEQRHLLVRQDLGDVVEERRRQAGVGPEVLGAGQAVGRGPRRQEGSLAQPQGLLRRLQGVAQQPPGLGVVMGLRGGQPLDQGRQLPQGGLVKPPPVAVRHPHRRPEPAHQGGMRLQQGLGAENGRLHGDEAIARGTARQQESMGSAQNNFSCLDLMRPRRSRLC